MDGQGVASESRTETQLALELRLFVRRPGTSEQADDINQNYQDGLHATEFGLREEEARLPAQQRETNSQGGQSAIASPVRRNLSENPRAVRGISRRTARGNDISRPTWWRQYAQIINQIDPVIKVASSNQQKILSRYMNDCCKQACVVLISFMFAYLAVWICFEVKFSPAPVFCPQMAGLRAVPSHCLRIVDGVKMRQLRIRRDS
jgi:hypothetical protein